MLTKKFRKKKNTRVLFNSLRISFFCFFLQSHFSFPVSIFFFLSRLVFFFTSFFQFSISPFFSLSHTYTHIHTHTHTHTNTKTHTHTLHLSYSLSFILLFNVLSFFLFTPSSKPSTLLSLLKKQSHPSIYIYLLIE